MSDIFSNQESAFNEAILKMQRIHKVQEQINELRTNMLAFNTMYNKYNYEIIISDLISLGYEVSPLMKPKELEEFFRFRRLVDDLLSYKPIHEQIRQNSLGESKTNKKINEANWKTLREVMLLFEDFARKQIDVHGLASPKKKDARFAAVDM